MAGTVAGYDGESFTAFLSSLGVQSSPPPSVNDLISLANATGEATQNIEDAAAAADDADAKKQWRAMLGIFAAAAVLLWVRPWEG